MSLSVRGLVHVVVWGFVVFMVVSDPDGASDAVLAVWDTVEPVFTNLGRFLGNLVQG